MTQTRNFCAGAGEAELHFAEGYFPNDHFSGLHDPLHARAVLLEGGGERVLLVSLELPSLRPFSLVDELRALLSRQTGVPVGRIWVCMTHDLTAPHVPNAETMPEKYRLHLQAVHTAVQQAVRQAQASLGPARLGVGVGQSFVNGNRDVYTNQGWWMGYGGKGESDKTLTVLKLERPDGAPVAMLCHYALKSSAAEGVLLEDGMRLASAEVSGRACLEAEARFGVPVLYFMGAAGDQVPRKKAQYWTADQNGDCVEVNEGRKGYDYIEELGSELGRDICAVAEGIVCKEELSTLRYEHRCWTYPGQKFYHGPVPYAPVTHYDYIPADDEDLPVELLCLGDVALFGLMPETSASIGVLLREKAPGWRPCLIAMVNGGKNYISAKLAYDRFTFGGTHAVFARGSAERFVEQAAALLDDIRREEAGQ